MHSKIALLVACSALLCAGAPLPEPAVTDSDWNPMNPALPGLGPAGCDAIVTRGSDMYVGGGFKMAGDVQARGVARWDGRHWHALGSGGSGVTSLALDSSGNLYAAGGFSSFGGVAANNVAKWDGTRWSALGSGLDNEVYALAVDRSGNLYAGGYFLRAGGDTAKRIAMWDGTRWKPVGAGLDSSVRAFAQDGAGNLYAGGDFSHAGGIAAAHVARWNGTSWSALGSGTDSYIHALTVAGTDLYAGGAFTTAGGAPASCIARWDGTSWSALGTGMNYPVEALSPRAKGGIYAAGQFTKAGGLDVLRAAAWDGAKWISLQDTVTIGLAIGSDTAGTVYLGGITNVDGSPQLNIARWDGKTWSAMGEGGFYGAVSALAGDTSGLVYFASRWFTLGGWGFQHVYRWKDGAVDSLPNLGGQVSSLALGRDGTLYAAGSFGDTGSLVPAIHGWKGGAWSPVGSGVVGAVGCLLADTLGNLYAGGNLTQAGGIAVDHVAKWDGKNWSAVGTGIGNWVRQLIVGDSGGLYAAGNFQGVRKWNGRTWSSVGSIPYPVVALARDDSGYLYASTDYSPEGAISSFNVLRWNGTKWELLGKGFSSQVNALASDGNTVYAGGAFRSTSDGVARHLARWTGSVWEPLGSGTDGDVWTLLPQRGLVVGGDFGTAGTWATPGLARLGVPFRRQSIRLLPHTTATYGDAPWKVTASSGLPVAVTSSNPGVATASNDTVSIRAAGSTTLRAVQGGDKIWLPVVRDENVAVARKSVSMAGAVAQDRVYDGTVAATVVFDSLRGVLAGDSVALVPGVAKFADRHAGTSKPVTDSGLQLAGRSSSNYLLETPVLSATIGPRPDTVKALPARKALGTSDPVFAYSASPLCAGDARTGSLTRDVGETEGTYAIRIGTLSDGPDYAMVFQTASFRIEAPDALAPRSVRPASVTSPSLRLGRVFFAPSRSAGPGELAPRTGSGSDDRARVEILLPSPGAVRVSIFDHLGTPVIAWDGQVDAAGWRGLPPSGDGRRILSVTWNLRSSSGIPVSDGVYLWKIVLKGTDGQDLEQVVKLGVSAKL